MPLKTHSSGSETWRCDACGAFNDEVLQVCSECKAERLATPSLAKGKKTKAKQKPLKAKIGKGAVKGKSSKKKVIRVKDVDVLETNVTSDEAAERKLTIAEPLVDSPVLTEPEPLLPLDTDDSINEQVQDVDIGEAHDDYVVGGPNRSVEPGQEEAHVESVTVSPALFSQPKATIGAGDHFSLVFINTPVSELIKRKIDVDFESFSVISIGRSPENVVVVPDAGVSRAHAELRKEGNRVILKDLQSSNGTYIYDGKEFQKVEDEVEIRPSTLVKLGTGTILRFISE